MRIWSIFVRLCKAFLTGFEVPGRGDLIGCDVLTGHLDEKHAVPGIASNALMTRFSRVFSLVGGETRRRAITALCSPGAKKPGDSAGSL
jgi:hypothetical protein